MLLKRAIAIATLMASTTLMTACDSGYNYLYNDDTEDEDAPACSSEMVISNPSSATTAVFDLIADLTCKKIKNYIVPGQSLGFGDEIADESNEYRSYKALIEELVTAYSKRVTIASVEYEETELFTEEQLESANETLESHFDDGGIVSVTWTPLNPWTSDSNLENKLATSADVDLASLYGVDETAAKTAFDERLDIVMAALTDLDEKGVPVLFAPFPQMNTLNRWYGPKDKETLDSEFKELWGYVLDRVKEEELKNVIMVYAPRSGTTGQRVSATWGYPGSSSVAIVAGIAYSDDVSITDFADYEKLAKPLGMTRLSPASTDGTFDNESYITELTERYPYIAYWIAEHDTAPDDTLANGIKRSIVRSESEKTMLNREETATTDIIEDKGWLETE